MLGVQMTLNTSSDNSKIEDENQIYFFEYVTKMMSAKRHYDQSQLVGGCLPDIDEKLASRIDHEWAEILYNQLLKKGIIINKK